MATAREEQHRSEIVEQFSRQAVPFTQVPGHLDALQTLVEMSGAGVDDEVLDVACGPGLVACEFARHTRHVTGLDVTPAMLEEAEARRLREGLSNLSWVLGEAVPLPFADDSFAAVLTRYSLHHLLAPRQALAEMIRVCPGGSVLVADVAVPAEKSAAYDRMEIMRDPSHTHALTEGEFEEMFRGCGLVAAAAAPTASM